MKVDCAIIGGGIVGLSTAMALLRQHPKLKVAVLEKEAELGQHQTGRNSGVIHSGIYYKPGSLKARFATSGNRRMIDFCRDHGIRHEICGKIIVATRENELSLLETLRRRGLENGLAVQHLSAEQVGEFEPHVRCLRGIRVPSTGIVDFREVCLRMAQQVQRFGGAIHTGVRIEQIRQQNGVALVESADQSIEARVMINCGGLHSDRLAQKMGKTPPAKIVPFRGEYYELTAEKRDLVKTLIYPVPNPEFPFLGVHFTRMIDGSVHAGPNAVLAFKREGYRKSDFDWADLRETLAYPGFWRLARVHYKEGLKEIYRSISKPAFVRELQRLIPEIKSDDLVPAANGVRAQALLPNGKLVDDFLIEKDRNSIHVCNAPSPAATASLEIGDAIAAQASEMLL